MSETVSGVSFFGKTDLEKHYEDMIVCRKIVKEIMDYGVSQNQLLRLIYLLSLELEDASKMRKITEITNLKKFDSDGKNEENSSSNVQKQNSLIVPD